LVPHITTSSKNYEVVKGSNQVLECQVDNLGRFVVLWRRGDRILSAGKLLVRKDGKVKVTNKYELELSDVDESDAGEYVCEVDVFGDTKEVTHSLDVLVSPRITSWERDLEVIAGDDVTIMCEATGNPPPKISWRKQHDGKLILPTEVSSKVVLKNVTREDSGLYICTANNNVEKEVKKTTKITVHYIPEVRLEEVWRARDDYFEVRLICHVHTYPAAQVTWYKDEHTKLSTSDEIVIEDDETKHVLKIESMKVKHFGQYKCRATNTLGKDEASIEINGKPRPPIFSSEMREILRSVKEVNITWSTDSIVPVTQYNLIVKKAQTGASSIQPSSSEDSTPKWLRSIIPVDHPINALTAFSSYTLRSLDNETVYDVRVKAVNKYGMSEFSKVFSFYVVAVDNKMNCEKNSECSQMSVSQAGADVAPQSLLTEAKEVASCSSTFPVILPVILVISSVYICVR